MEVGNQLSSSVGGLSKSINELGRRILLSRTLPEESLRALGLSHVKGILFYGAPGTGKTLMARELSKLLNSNAPKIINGPDIIDKYVGESEKNIRELFREAEIDWATLGSRSPLHVVIFDEIDAIGKSRGTLDDGSGTRDGCVNQLLSKMDGTFICIHLYYHTNIFHRIPDFCQESTR